VSFGIRRCEFDHYLLQRSQARLLLGHGLSSIRREGAEWIVNEAVRTPMLVGAGGHFCPVARTLNGPIDMSPLIAAQEVEFADDSTDDSVFRTSGETPELYFCSDFKGYGWCFRKQRYLNIGFGRLDPHAVPRATAAFVNFLKRTGRISADATWRMRGHAYLLSSGKGRRTVDDGVVVIGDAAGLAYPQSGEGIRPAIESGLMAASAILAARGNYSRERLVSYEHEVHHRFGVSRTANLLARIVPASMTLSCARRLLKRPWFVRRMVLDRWFLHAHEAALR
jgi:flavin-dependent dehydrogenase